MDPDFGQYKHFYGTTIDKRTYRNLYKMVTQYYLRQKRSDIDIFYFKTFLVEHILIMQNVLKTYVITLSKGFKL